MKLRNVPQITARGYHRLQSERQRQRQFLKNITQQIRENIIPKDAEDFAHAISMQQRAQDRIHQLDYVLGRAEIVHNGHDGTIEIGSKIRLQQNSRQSHVITIVGSEEADPIHGAVSADSPLGQAVLGRAKGDHVSFMSPSGQREVTIVDIA